jgi:hypothetical protein
MAKKLTDQLNEEIRWLADAPLFIDAEQVNRFHDAIVQPESRQGATVIEVTKEMAGQMGAKVGLSAEIEPTNLLQTIASYFPFLNFKLNSELAVEGNVHGSRGETEKIEFYAISSPERQLIHLTLHYLAHLPHRIQFVSNLSSDDWRRPDFILTSPRALVFLDIPREVKIIPTAAEFQDGTIELLYMKLEAPIKSKLGDRFYDYPRDPKPAALKKYWLQFDSAYEAKDAMVIIEEASAKHKGGIRWIDYRVKLTNEGDTLHLHVNAASKYDTGVFAYNFVKRTYKHGVRLVGTLKSEPDMNVLAIYDK